MANGNQNLDQSLMGDQSTNAGNTSAPDTSSQPTLDNSLMSGPGPGPQGPTLDDSLMAGNSAAQPASQPHMSRLKAMLLGLEMRGLPGMIVGAADPGQVQDAVNNRRAIAQANVQKAQADATFANLQAAHEASMAYKADLEYQYLPAQLQQEQEKRGFDTLKAAKDAGYMPVATVALDQGQAQNSQNAMAAISDLKKQYGSVPASMLYVHTGNGMTVLKLNDPNAALPLINQVRKGRGMPALDANTFGALSQTDKEKMAKDAMSYTDPRDQNGMVTQDSLTLANMNLLTLQQQPNFDGKDALVSQLQATVAHQKNVLDSGAAEAAIRAGAAKGAEAQAAQPGQTAAKVADINATAGPKANAAALEAGAAQRAKNQADMAAMQGNQDAFGNQVGVTPEGQQLNVKEYNSRADKFAKDYVQPLNVLAKTNAEFQRINSNPNQTGAERVTALLNAVGISGDPLKGKGFRISNDVINEHATARNIWQGAVQKLNTIAGSGGPITSQQIADYTSVAQGVVHDAYVTAAQEAQRQGLPVNFLPKATQQGQAPDRFTAKIYLDAAGGNVGKAHKAMVAAGWAQ